MPAKSRPRVLGGVDRRGDRTVRGGAQVLGADGHHRGAGEGVPDRSGDHLGAGDRHRDATGNRPGGGTDQVAIAHELRDVGMGGAGVEVLRRADLAHRAVAHHHDAVGERERLVLVVGHVDRGGTQHIVDAPDLGAHLQAQLGVEVRQRLVHQHQWRFDDDRAGDRDALLLAARQLPGRLVGLLAETHEGQRLVHPAVDLGTRAALGDEAEADIAAHRHVRKQRVVLEHHREAAVFRTERVDAALIEPDRAAGQREAGRRRN